MRLSKSENRNNFEIKPRNELAKSEIYKYSDLLTENGLQTKYRPKEKESKPIIIIIQKQLEF